MVYADYAYYTAEYLGDAIPKEAFPRAALRASAKIDGITKDRAESYLSAHPDDTKIKSATCAIADVLYTAEKNSRGAEDASGNAIQSESNDGYSVTYRAPKEASISGLEKSCYDAAFGYLRSTGLLYAGVTYLC